MARKFLDFAFWSYLCFRLALFPLSFLPYTWIHALGKILGKLAYFVLPSFRKKTLSNLALAKSLNLSEKKLLKTAKESFENLAITLLEFVKWDREKQFHEHMTVENPEVANNLYKNKQGMIFFCGHQANWETLFLEGNLHMKGVAIGKPFKNFYLYQWITSIREKTGGKMIEPKGAIHGSLKALKEGQFVGILGDQGMPDSHFSSQFFNRRCWTSPIPAYLSYKTNSPILVATVRREKNKYVIHYSDPIWPNQNEEKEKEVLRLMHLTLEQFEESIRKNPGEYLWQHNRYKQQLPQRIFKEFRHDALAIILPEEEKLFFSLYPHLKTLFSIYENHFIFLFVPKKFGNLSFPQSEEIHFYHHIDSVLKRDFRFKLVFNFTPYSFIKPHFLALSALKVLSLTDLEKIAKKSSKALIEKENYSKLFLTALCRKGITL